MGQACSALAKLVVAAAADDDARSRRPLEYEVSEKLCVMRGLVEAFCWRYMP